MNVIFFLLPMALLLGLGFLGAFIFATRDGQFEDLDTPAHRMLLDDEMGNSAHDQEIKTNCTKFD